MPGTRGLCRGGLTPAGGSAHAPGMAECVRVCNSRLLVRQYGQGCKGCIIQQKKIVKERKRWKHKKKHQHFHPPSGTATHNSFIQQQAALQSTTCTTYETPRVRTVYLVLRIQIATKQFVEQQQSIEQIYSTKRRRLRLVQETQQQPTEAAA